MRSQNSIQASCLTGCIASLCIGAAATSAAIINFDENGNGTIIDPSGVVTPLTSLGNQTDPIDPTNGLKPLIYSLPAFGGVIPVSGDVEVFEPTTPPSLHSDLLRWANTATGPLLIVYSDRPETSSEPPDLADVGIPALRQPNVITRLETGPEVGPNGLFGYTPTPNEPGFYPTTVAGPTVYNFLSDAVPEPSQLAMLGLASLTLLRRPRRR